MLHADTLRIDQLLLFRVVLGHHDVQAVAVQQGSAVSVVLRHLVKDGGVVVGAVSAAVGAGAGKAVVGAGLANLVRGVSVVVGDHR